MALSLRKNKSFRSMEPSTLQPCRHESENIADNSCTSSSLLPNWASASIFLPTMKGVMENWAHWLLPVTLLWLGYFAYLLAVVKSANIAWSKLDLFSNENFEIFQPRSITTLSPNHWTAAAGNPALRRTAPMAAASSGSSSISRFRFATRSGRFRTPPPPCLLKRKKKAGDHYQIWKRRG